MTTPHTHDAGRNRGFDAVLFDFGHTLFAHRGGVEVVAAQSARLGRPLSEARSIELWDRIDRAAMDPAEVARGRDLDDAVWRDRWRVLYGLADEVVDGLGPAIDADFHDPWAWHPYADTAATLEALHGAQIAVGIVSNTGWDVRDPFRVRELDRYVDSFTLSYECGSVKPQPEIFHEACRSLGVDPTRALMVGDDRVADSGALAAGLGELVLVDPATPIGDEHGLDAVVALATGPRD